MNRGASCPFIRYPVLQVRTNALLVYERTEWMISGNRKERGHNLLNLKAATPYAGLINHQSRKKLKRAIQLLLAIAEPKQRLNPTTNKWYTFKVNFITLTLPTAQGGYTDKQIKKEVLDVWLKSAKRIFKLGSYVWRAERQVNGNVHFHFITDTFIPYDQLRDSWNQRLERLGMISAFEKKWGHRHPNSTDVHAVNKIRNLAAYICKYVSKGNVTAVDLIPQPPFAKPREKVKVKKNGPRFRRLLTLDEQKINGRVWDCSTNLKHKGNCEFMMDEAETNLWIEATDRYPGQTIRQEKFSLVTLDPRDLQSMLKGHIKAQYTEWINIIKKIPDKISLPPIQKAIA